jgi:hypothetical protein
VVTEIFSYLQFPFSLTAASETKDEANMPIGLAADEIDNHVT